MLSLFQAKVIIERQSEVMVTMKLDKDRASYLLDKVIIPSLKLDVHDLFDAFMRVLEEHDVDTKRLCEDLKLHLRQSLSQQPSAESPLMLQYSVPPYGRSYPNQLPYMDNHLIPATRTIDDSSRNVYS